MASPPYGTYCVSIGPILIWIILERYAQRKTPYLAYPWRLTAPALNPFV